MAEEKDELFGGLESFLKTNNLMEQNFLEESLAKEREEEKKEDESKKEVEKEEDKGLTEEEVEEIFKGESDEEEEKTEKKEKENEKENEESSPYSILSQMLKEEGILESEFNSSEEMIKVFSETIKEGIESYKSELPEEIKNLIDNYEDGVPLDEIIKIKSEQIRLENIDDDKLEESEELQKTLYRNYLKATTKFSDAKIEKEISRLVDLDELLDSSKEAKEALKEIHAEEIEKAKQEALIEKQKRQEEYKEQINFLNDRIKKTSEIIPGIKINEKDQKELFKAITTPVETRGDTLYNQVMVIREKDPIGFEMKLNYYIKMGLFDEVPKFDTILKKNETKAVSKLEKDLEESLKKTFNKNSGSSKSNSSENDDIFEALKKTKLK
jgi:hypothetical protein